MKPLLHSELTMADTPSAVREYTPRASLPLVPDAAIPEGAAWLAEETPEEPGTWTGSLQRNRSDTRPAAGPPREGCRTPNGGEYGRGRLTLRREACNRLPPSQPVHRSERRRERGDAPARSAGAGPLPLPALTALRPPAQNAFELKIDQERPVSRLDGVETDLRLPAALHDPLNIPITE